MKVNHTVKQVIVVRKDLKNTQGHKVRTGKIIAQACHAAESWLLNNLVLISPPETPNPVPDKIGAVYEKQHATHAIIKNGVDENVKKWIEEGRKKIVLAIHNEEELMHFKTIADPWVQKCVIR